MRVGPVIVTNTPLVTLWVLGRLDLLRELYDEVLIPQAVYRGRLCRGGAKHHGGGCSLSRNTAR